MGNLTRHRRPSGSKAPPLAVLVLVTGVGPLALDTYLPALPALQHSLSTSAAVAQLTVTAYISGLALGQLVIGAASDGTGRRTPLLCSTAAFMTTCVICAIAPNAGLLIVVRLLGGLAAGAGVATGRAVVSDYYEGNAAAKKFGTLASINFLGPVVAPAIGGLILTVGTWRTIFWSLSGLGVVMFVAVAARLPESLPPSERHRGGVTATWARMVDLLGTRVYLRHVLVSCLATAGFFTYIGGSSFVLQTVYGISQTEYAIVFSVNALAMVVAGALFRVLVGRAGAVRLRLAGLLLATIASVALVGLAFIPRSDRPSVVAPWIILSCVVAGMGLVIPASVTLAQQAGERFRGTASALQGGLSFLSGALVTPLTGVLGDTSLTAMALLMAGFMLAAVAALAATSSPGWTGVQHMESGLKPWRS